MADVHLRPFNPDTSEPDDREQAVYAIAVTGLFILMLAGINFVNLITARAACRAKEVGIRKAAGALATLVVQFMGEAMGYAFAGLLIGMGLAAICLPSLNAFLDRQIEFDVWRQPQLAAVPLATAMLLGILAAAPALAVVLSGFSPARVLKTGAGGAAAGGRFVRPWLCPFNLPSR